MDTPRLDKTPGTYGEIHPPHRGAMYQQGPHYFSGSGEYLFSDGQTEPAPKRAKAKPAAKSEPEDDHQSGEGAGDGDGQQGQDAPADIVAWLKGEKNLPFFTVKKEVAAHWPDIDTANTKSIVDGLVAAGVLPADEVKR